MSLHVPLREGPLSNVPAAIKLSLALVSVVSVALWPVGMSRWLLIPAGLVLAWALVSRVPFGELFWRLLKLEPLALGIAGLAVFQPGGWRLAALLLGKSTLCLLTMLLLASTTPFGEILRVLRAVRVPELLVTTLGLMYRYLFVLADEAQRMRRARASRTFAGGRAAAWWASATVVGQLFVRASERAERIYAAMCARGGEP